MSRLRHLNGWQRLFVLVAALFGLAVSAFTVATAPSASNTTFSWSSEALAALEADVKRTSGREATATQFRESKAFLGKTDEQIARDLAENARSIDLKEVGKEDLGRYKEEMAVIQSKYEQRLRELPHEQARHGAIAFAFWLGTSLAVLALGYALTWVGRGFRRT